MAAVLAAVLLLDGGDGMDGGAPARAARAPAPVPGADTQVIETDGRLAVGITEPNPAFVRPVAAGAAPEPFGRWQRALDTLRPAVYRLVLNWAALQPDANRPADLAAPEDGCGRGRPPCAAWQGVRAQLEAVARRQRATGMEVLVVITGSPAWAARPAGGCERAGIESRSRPARPSALGTFRALVAATLAEADRAGARLRYWSAWNEPNHPYFLSPQRSRCSASARSASVGPYVELVRALRTALAAAPGDQEYVLGELAALRRKPRSTAVGEFARALPDDLVCGARAWSQHDYVGGEDPVETVAAALSAHGCDKAPEIWITETGVGAPRAGAARDTSPAGLRAACLALHERLLRWYEDPRVTTAVQYTLREDDAFPTGLVDSGLTRAYPALRAWQAWGGRRAPEAPAPSARAACG